MLLLLGDHAGSLGESTLLQAAMAGDRGSQTPDRTLLHAPSVSRGAVETAAAQGDADETQEISMEGQGASQREGATDACYADAL